MNERRTSPVELLWDLVFVFAVTQVATLVADGLSWNAVGHGAILLALVWWAWSAFVWIANAMDPSDWTFRGALIVALIAIFVAAIALPHAFGGEDVDPTHAGDEAVVFAVAYVIVRFIHLGLYARASRAGNAAWSAIVGFALATTAGMALLLAGAFAHHSARVILWLCAIAIDYAGPAWLTRERLAGLQAVAVAHFAERYALFIIICLGESVIDIGAGASSRHIGFGLVAAVALSLLIVVGLWWIYFGRAAGDAEERLRRHTNPVLAAADAYSYIHLLLVAGIVFFASGARWAIAGISVQLDPVARAGLFFGVALYLLGHAAFRLRIASVLDTEKIAAAVAIAVGYVLFADLAAWICLTAIAVVLALLTVVDRSERPAAG